MNRDADLRVRKMLGRSHLNAHRFEDAFGIYASILQSYPDDVEANLTLADLYLASNNHRVAEQLYRRVQQLDPAHQGLERRLQLARSGPRPNYPWEAPAGVSSGWEDPQQVEETLTHLTGQPTPPCDAELERAAGLLSEIITSANPGQKVAERLDDIDALLPALIELNIRQSRAAGRPDVAEGLQQLQTNIALQLRGSRLAAANPPAAEAASPRTHFTGRVQILAAQAAELTPRMALAAEGLRAKGCEVLLSGETSLLAENKPGLVMVSNPHARPRLMENMAIYSAAGVPILVDLDTDFERLPVNHPEYSDTGLTNPSTARAYTSTLLLANHITVPTGLVASSLATAGFRASVVPDGWTRANPLWQSPAPARRKIHLGWSSACGQLEDLLSIRRILLRVMREFSETQLVIVGDMAAYQAFDSLPESRRLYLPPVAPEDYPNLLAQMDILLVPLREMPFNYSLSDLPLVEAGVRAIPWAASGLPWVTQWKAGGLAAANLDEWHTNLRQLVLDAELRASLAQAGARQAAGREAAQLADTWLEIIDEITA